MKSHLGQDIMTTGTTPAAEVLRHNTPTRGATPRLVFRRLNTSALGSVPASVFRRLNIKDLASTVQAFRRLNIKDLVSTVHVIRRLNTSALGSVPATVFRRLNTKDQESNVSVFRRLNTSGLRTAPAIELEPSTTCPMGVMNRPHLGKTNDRTSRIKMTSIHLYRQVRRDQCSWRVYTNEHPSISTPPEPRLERGSVFWGCRKGKTMN